MRRQRDIFPNYYHHAQFHLSTISNLAQLTSFNFPGHYDSPLVTPDSLTHSPPLPASPAAMSRKDLDIKLSPAHLSPTFPWLGSDEEYGAHRAGDMKHKDHHGARHMSVADSTFPQSPVSVYSPYYGAFGVSAAPMSTPGSSVSMHHSPSLSAGGGFGGGDRPQAHNASPRLDQAYGSHAQAATLLSTPNQLALRTASPHDGGDYRRGSLQPRSPHSPAPSPALAENLGPLPSRRKRKPLKDAGDGEIRYSGEMNEEERVLIQLTVEENLPWKEVAVKYKEHTGKIMKVPALQMRKKRLIERLRVWTPAEVK